MAGEDILNVPESCPNCGGRVSGIRDEMSGEVSAMCMGMFGDEKSCGWTLVRPEEPSEPVKRTA
ncbi:MAG: hypothetical protein GTN93_21380 [Anaerolineae bacterium]|nr:hypothetical protein [Anaerolineae bacterium]